jgi:hypothetical protein
MSHETTTCKRGQLTLRFPYYKKFFRIYSTHTPVILKFSYINKDAQLEHKVVPLCETFTELDATFWNRKSGTQTQVRSIQDYGSAVNTRYRLYNVRRTPRRAVAVIMVIEQEITEI